MQKLVLLALGMVLAAAPMAAQEAATPKPVDITGAWVMTVETPQGQMTMTANFKQDGETLTGTHVEYTLTLDMGGQQMAIVHKATVDGDTLTGSADIEGVGSIAFTAKRKQ